MKNLSTNYGATTTNGNGIGYANETGDLQSNSYQMSTLTARERDDEYKYRIWSGGEPKEADADAASFASCDSQRMIIQKGLI